MLSRTVVLSGWATVGAGAVLMAVHYLAGADGDPEGWDSAAGFAAPFVGAGCLALVGDRFATPRLCAAGGVGLAVSAWSRSSWFQSNQRHPTAR